MPRRVLLIGISLCAAAGLAACKSAERQYDLRRMNLSCEGANRYAYRAMSQLGYEITEFEPATAGRAGLIRARKQMGKKGKVEGRIDIVCGATEVSLASHEQSGLVPDLVFARGFYLAFSHLADAGERSRGGEESGGDSAEDSGSGGLTLNITPVPGLEAKLDFGVDLQGAGILPVRIRAVNKSSRAYRIDTGSIRLRAAGRLERVSSLPIDRAARFLAAAAEKAERAGGPPARQESYFASLLKTKLIKSVTLAPGELAEGFLFFPGGDYAGARAVVEDVRTKEPEGFMVEF